MLIKKITLFANNQFAVWSEKAATLGETVLYYIDKLLAVPTARVLALLDPHLQHWPQACRGLRPQTPGLL